LQLGPEGTLRAGLALAHTKRLFAGGTCMGQPMDYANKCFRLFDDPESI
jgi:hypothetical protein